MEKDRFVYQRTLDGRSYLIDCNLGKKERKAFVPKDYECIFTTDRICDTLGSYEARIWKNKE